MSVLTLNAITYLADWRERIENRTGQPWLVQPASSA
jgi:hypothetical protein